MFFSRFLLVSLVSLAMPAFAKTHHKHNHEEAELGIAVQGNTATVEFKSPASTIYGFEHVAKTPSHIKKRDDGVKKLETKISEILKFDSKLNCKITTQKVDPFVAEGHDHGEVHATFNVACEKPLAGSKLNFGATKVFPKMERLDVKVVGDKPTGAEIKKDKGSVDL